MAIITCKNFGFWSNVNTWEGGVIPGNGDTVIIPEAYIVTVDIDQSGVANGLNGIDINGQLNFKKDVNTCIKMNGDITGTGKLNLGQNRGFIGNFELVPGKSNTYVVGTGTVYYATIVEDLEGFKVLNKANNINEVEDNPNSFYMDRETNNCYVHYKDGTDPTNKVSYINEIERPNAGTESRCTLIFNATGKINVPTIRAAGWYNEKEFAQISADAGVNETEIPLKEDLDLKAGDIISIGTGTVFGAMTETNNGIYTVQSYNAETKTITLTNGLQTARLKGDYIGIVSKTIKLMRTSGTTAYLSTGIEYNIHLEGLCIDNAAFAGFNENTAPQENYVAKHCTIRKGRIMFMRCENVLLEDCMTCETANAGAAHNGSGVLKRCIGFQGGPCYGGRFKMIDCVTQNTWNPPAVGITENMTVKNLNSMVHPCNTVYINSSIGGAFTPNMGGVMNFPNMVFNDCSIIDEQGINGLKMHCPAKFNNCLFEGQIENISGKDYIIIESFNHNRIPGDYRAWCKGGQVETVPGGLKFICESEDSPVFKDYPISAPANRLLKFRCNAVKTFNNGEVKLQVIDPFNDPLVDDTALPLAEQTMQEITGKPMNILVRYKSPVARELILRVFCKNGTGDVLIRNVLYNASARKGI